MRIARTHDYLSDARQRETLQGDAQERVSLPMLTDSRTVADKFLCKLDESVENWGQLCGERCELTGVKDVENYF